MWNNSNSCKNTIRGSVGWWFGRSVETFQRFIPMLINGMKVVAPAVMALLQLYRCMLRLLLRALVSVHRIYERDMETICVRYTYLKWWRRSVPASRAPSALERVYTVLYSVRVQPHRELFFSFHIFFWFFFSFIIFLISFFLSFLFIFLLLFFRCR